MIFSLTPFSYCSVPMPFNLVAEEQEKESKVLGLTEPRNIFGLWWWWLIIILTVMTVLVAMPLKVKPMMMTKGDTDINDVLQGDTGALWDGGGGRKVGKSLTSAAAAKSFFLWLLFFQITYKWHDNCTFSVPLYNSFWGGLPRGRHDDRQFLTQPFFWR